MTSVVSQPRPAAVSAVLARSSEWVSARRKSDGRPFFVVPGSKPGVAYYADATACTCPDARERGRVCKHSLAIQRHQSRQRPAFRRLADLTDGCAATGCPNDREPHEQFCIKHVTVSAF